MDTTYIKAIVVALLFALTLFGFYAMQDKNLGATAFYTATGGTGSTSPSGILYGDNSSTNHLNTVTIGSNITFSGGTLSASGGGGSGTVSTSTVPTVGQLAYWTSNAFPSLLGSVATSGASCTTGVSCSAFTVVGTVSPSITSTLGTSVDLASEVTGVLPYLNGGTGSTTAPQGQLLYGGATAYQSVATGTISGSTGLSVTAGQSIIGSGLTITNTGVTSNVAGNGIQVSGATGAVTITNSYGYPFTPTTDFGLVTSATSTAVWARLGIFASTTSHFDGADFQPNVGIGTSSPYGMLSIGAPATTSPYFVIGSSTEVFKITPSGTARFFLGTSTPFTSSTGVIATLTAGGTSTTTINFGEIGGTGKTQFNVQTSAGTAACMYVNGAFSLIVQSGVCL